MSAPEALRHALARVRRERKLRVAALVLMRLFTGTGVGYVAALFGAYALSPDYRSPVFAAFFLLGLGAGLFGALAAWRRSPFRLTDAQAAALLAPLDETARNVLVAGADLAGWGENGAKARGADPELAAQGVELAAKVARNLPPRHQVGPELAQDGRLFAPVLVGVLLAATLGPAITTSTVAQVVAGYSGRPVAVGNLILTYRPPAYTNLPVTTEEGGTGDVTAYPGTQVTLSAQLGEKVDSGAFVGPDRQEIPLELEGENLKVTFAVKKPGNYGLKFAMKGLAVPSGFEPRAITLLVDKAPQVELVEPVTDLEAMNLEEIRVSFLATDDFGVERATLVLSGKEEVRIPLRIAPGQKAAGEARFLPAAHKKLGEGAYLYVEARDNDTVNGPKVAQSRSVYLTFFDSRKLAAEIEGLNERLMEALLALLADHLENPSPDAAMLDKLKESGKDLDKLLKLLVERATRKDAEELGLGEAAANIAATLTLALDRWAADPAGNRSSFIAELERDIIFLDNLKRQMKVEEALSMGDELSALQRDLFDRLQRGEDTKALLEAVSKIEKTLEEIAKKLSDKENLPDEFANSDAVRDMPKDSLTQMLEELKDALKSGDRKKAAELAEKIMKELDKLMKGLEKAAEEGEDPEAARVAKKLDEISEEVAGAAAEQERILSETRKTGETLSKKTLEEMRAKLQEFLAKQRQRLDEITRLTQFMEGAAARGNRHDPGSQEWAEIARKVGEERNRLNQQLRQTRTDLDEAFAQTADDAEKLEKNIGDFQDAVEKISSEEGAREEPRQLGEQARQLARQIKEDVAALLGSRKERAGEKEKKELKGQGEDEDELSRGIDKIGEKLDKLSKESPFVKPGAGQKAGEAAKAASGAGKSLGQGDPFNAMGGQMETLEKLGELAGDLEQMKQSGSQGKGKGQRGKRPGQRPRSGEGGRDVNRDKVEIPAEAQGEQLKKLREEVMKTMREGRYQKDYREETRRYFEGLIK